MFDIKGKNIIITGGGRGIGRAACLKYAQEGANIAVAGRTLDHVQKVCDEAKQYGVKAIAIQADVSDALSVRKMVDAAVKEFGTIDVMLNNAGICTISSVEDMSVDEWKSTLDTNLTGVFLCCRAIIPQMKKQGYGKIINMASQSGKQPAAQYAHYCASKAGVILFTRCLALELGEFGITANSVCPGFVDTDMLDYEAEFFGRQTGKSPEEISAGWIPSIPIGRLSPPEEIADLCLFLASSGADGITGEDVNVTGGATMF